MGIKKLLSLLFFVLIISPSILAQTGKINGIITDQNGEPLPGVNVQIEGQLKGASTDVDGFYTILNVLPGRYTLRATYIGFASVRVQDVEVNVNLTTTIDFQLAEETIEGEEIIVVAERPVIKKDVSSSTANIQKEDIEALPVTSVTSVVGLQAGIENGLNIRGSGSDEIAFNLNGFTLRSDRDNTPFTGISVTSIQNVQVQTGGFNAEYGDIRSGLVNVTSKEGERDRYTIDAVIRYTPPQAKHFGQSINSPESYWIRPFVDDEVAWTGIGDKWDSYTQDQYPSFRGWNQVSKELLADDDPSNDLTPEGAQQLFLWQHRKSIDISDPDYDIDVTIGGPVPAISKGLGDLRFSASLKTTQNTYLIPLSRDSYNQTTFQGRLTSNIASGMKLSFDGLYSKQLGTGASQSGNPGFFRSASGIAGNMDLVSFIDCRIYCSDYWAPSEVTSTNFGVQFTHTLSENTFYEVKINRFHSENSTNPGAFRDTSDVISIGGKFFDAGPFGFFDSDATGIGSNMRMGIGLSTSRDSSKISRFTSGASITSQVDRYNQVKAGIEFIHTSSNVNYGRLEPNLPTSNTRNVWDANPIRLATYIQNKLEFEGLIVNAGLRLTYSDPNILWYDYDPFNEAFTRGGSALLDTVNRVEADKQIVLQPRLGVSFPITENNKLYFNYGHFVQLPDPEDLYLIGISPAEDQIIRIASPGNPLPKTVSYELGYEQSIFEKYLFRISGYYKDLSQQPILVDYVDQQLNIDYTLSEPFSYEDIRGLEITFRKQAAKVFWGEANYTYSIASRGLFGSLERYRTEFAQLDYERRTDDNDLFRPVPQPFARLQLFFRSPNDFGPEFLGGRPLGDWLISSIISWRAGGYVTSPEAAAIDGLTNNLQAKDFWNTSMRISRSFEFAGGNSLSFFADISNVLNTKYMNVNNAGFVDGDDRRKYFESLHLPKNKLDELGITNIRVIGKDKPGDYRDFGVDFVPIEAGPSFDFFRAEGNLNNRALYYNTTTGTYHQYVNDTFVEADEGLVSDVLDNKAYIDMPNQRYFNFLNPRNFNFGIKFSF